MEGGDRKAWNLTELGIRTIYTSSEKRKESKYLMVDIARNFSPFGIGVLLMPCRDLRLSPRLLWQDCHDTTIPTLQV